MSEVVGTGVFKLSADATELHAKMDAAKRSVNDLGSAVGDSAEKGSRKASAAIEAYVRQAEANAKRVGLSFREAKIQEFSERGASPEQIARLDASLKIREEYKRQQESARETARISAALAAQSVRDQQAIQRALGNTAYKNVQLGYQLQDFFVQVSSGQSPLTAFIQQGSQLSGTFGSMGAAAQAVLGIFTPFRLAMMAGAAAVGLYAKAMLDADAANAAFSRSVALTGNASGITASGLQELARSSANAAKTSISAADESLRALIGTGQIYREDLGRVNEATLLLAKVTGKATDEIAASFAGAAREPLKFAQETNSAYNYLSAAQLENIRQLEDQGRRQEALNVIVGSLIPRLRAGADATSTWSAAWDRFKVSVSDAYSAMNRRFSGAETQQEAIAALEKQAAAQEKVAAHAKRIGQADAQELADKAAATREIIRLNSKSLTSRESLAAATEAATKKERALGDANALMAKYADNATKRTEALAAAREKLAAAGISEQDPRYKKTIASIQDQFKDKVDRGAIASAESLKKAKLDNDLKLFINAQESQTAAVARAGQLIEAARAAQLINEREYYDAKRGLVSRQSEIDETSLSAQLTRLEAERAATKAGSKERLEVLAKIGDAEKKLAESRADSATKTVIADIQQKAAEESRRASLAEQVNAIERYLETLREQAALEARLVGAGGRRAERARGEAQISQRYSDQIDELRRRAAKDPRKASDLQSEIDALESAKRRELEIFKAGNEAILGEQGNWLNGMTKAFEDYADTAADVAKQSGDAFTKAFNGIEDAIVQMVTKGKADFKSLADSIIADLVRIYVKQQLVGLVKFIGGLSANGSQTGTPTTSIPIDGYDIGSSKAPTLGKGAPNVVINMSVKNEGDASPERSAWQAEQIKRNTLAAVSEGLRRGQLGVPA